LLHVNTIYEVRDACDHARARDGRVGLVPTMGFLHAGHLSLMQAARAETDFVVASIFVNPLQFGPSEDLDRYPRDLDADLAACEAVGVDCVFTPDQREMYPVAPVTTVHVAHLTEIMCGIARPTHFDGVTTVVTKLFSIVGPCYAYFGRKDAQQLAVIRRMVSDLNLPVHVVGRPLVREPDGLALSSRNAYLSPEERAAAPVLSQALFAGAEAVVAGERDPATVAAVITAAVQAEPLVDLEYIEIRDARDLRALGEIEGEVLVALAARIGSTRLIDNVGLKLRGGEVDVDRGVRAAC
jgi:pantoate--beta-alanine ligase